MTFLLYSTATFIALKPIGEERVDFSVSATDKEVLVYWILRPLGAAEVTPSSPAAQDIY